MHLNAYLTFNGQCEAAFKFYEKCLGGKIVAMFPHAGTPAESMVPPEWGGKIMHACLKAGDDMLMGSDAPPDRYRESHGFAVNIAVQQTADAERIFAALSENGKVGVPLAKTFWAERWGMVTDQFGIPWMVNCEGNVKYE